MQTFKFTREHIHAGRHFVPGDCIDLPEHAAQRLRGFGAGQIVDKPSDQGEAPAASPKPRKSHIARNED